MVKTIFHSFAALIREILFHHSKIKFISSHRRVISSIYWTDRSDVNQPLEDRSSGRGLSTLTFTSLRPSASSKSMDSFNNAAVSSERFLLVGCNSLINSGRLIFYINIKPKVFLEYFDFFNSALKIDANTFYHLFISSIK